MAEKQLYLVHLNNVLLTALSTPFHVCVDVDPIRPPSLTMDITHTQNETYPYPTFGHVDAFHGIFQLSAFPNFSSVKINPGLPIINF